MRLKARPDLHHAPLPDGVYISSATGEFALSGWSGFADLVARCLPLLGRGAAEDELVAALGTERARPAVRRLLAALDEHDMLLRIDDLAPGPPGALERKQHAELLAYLECRSTRPYEAFEEIRSTRILLTGPDQALAAAEGALRELGVAGTATQDGARPHDVAVTVLRRDRVDLTPPHAARLLPVVVGAHAVLVGPMTHDLEDWSRWRALVARTLDRDGQPIDDEAATAVAASAAVHLLLQDLASVGGPSAYVVSGDTLDVTALDLSPHDDPGGTHPPGGPGGPDAAEVTLGSASDDGHDADLATWLERQADPWLGLVRRLDEDALPQMPVALRRLAGAGDQVLVAQGPDQSSAAAAATLAVARWVVEDGEAGPGHAAAGTSALRWLLDGALRHLTGCAGEPHAFAVRDAWGRRLLAHLAERGLTPRTSVRTVEGIGWVLVRCVLPGGGSTAGWGPDADAAAGEALSRAVADDLLGGESAFLQAPGTTALLHASPEDVAALAADVLGWLSGRSSRLVGRPQPPDPHLGPGPVRSGRVRLVDDTDQRLRPPAYAGAGTLDGLVSDLVARTGADVVTTAGWEHDVLAEAVHAAEQSGRTMIPLQLGPDSVVVGPAWSPGVASGCPACAEIRRRIVVDHVLGTDLTIPAVPGGPPPASLLELATTTLRATRALRKGEVLVVSTDGVSRHDVLRHPACPWCGADPGADPPHGLELCDAPVGATDPTRVVDGTPLLDPARLDEAIDEQYGPVRGILREETVPQAMSMALLAGGPALGHGRALSFEETRPVAVLEAYERLAGFPYEAPILTDRTFREVAEDAVDPLRLGRYSAEQLAHPTSRVVPYHPDLAMDWAWGTDLATGARRLVPADVAFYQYDHAFKRDARAAQAATAEERRRVFLESSSGCALGSGLTEATVHALFEVAERDAFLLAWHRARPLPSIPAAQLSDPVVDALVALVESRGFDVHFLRATQDVDLPVVWVLAVSRDGSFPGSFSSAGSGADAVGAARSGLREVAQLVTMPLDWDEAEAARLVADRWRVVELADHVRWASAPGVRDRVTSVLGGPEVSVAEAFPGWPAALRPPAGAGILAVLEQVRARFAAAGLTEVVVVDQSTREHRDQRVDVVKAVVPGTVPMVFGQAHQRLLGIPRLEAALAERSTQSSPGSSDGSSHPYDPHPFP